MSYITNGERVRAWEVREGAGVAGQVLVNGTSMGAHKIALWNLSSASTNGSLTLVVTKMAGGAGPVRIAQFSAFEAKGCV